MDIQQKLNDIKTKISSNLGKTTEEVEDMFSDNDSKSSTEIETEKQLANAKLNLEKHKNNIKFDSMEAQQKAEQQMEKIGKEIDDLENKLKDSV